MATAHITAGAHDCRLVQNRRLTRPNIVLFLIHSYLSLCSAPAKPVRLSYMNNPGYSVVLRPLTVRPLLPCQELPIIVSAAAKACNARELRLTQEAGGYGFFPAMAALGMNG
jgi:hypothetical protein